MIRYAVAVLDKRYHPPYRMMNKHGIVSPFRQDAKLFTTFERAENEAFALVVRVPKYVGRVTVIEVSK